MERDILRDTRMCKWSNCKQNTMKMCAIQSIPSSLKMSHLNGNIKMSVDECLKLQ